jgi:cardiolipin synthase
LFDYWQHVTVLALLQAGSVAIFVPWILLTKRDSTVAVAWCLTVLFMPLLGALLFWVFGSNPVRRHLGHKQAHRLRFQESHPPRSQQAVRGKGDGGPAADDAAHQLDRLALAVNAFPPSPGNAVTLFHDTGQAFADLLGAIGAARHHVHLEYFIVRSDATGRRLFDLLAQKARAGVEVRLLYDSWGGLFLKRRLLRPLIKAGGQVATFLPVNPLRSRIRVNRRNHRKITVVDGRAGFTGGMNIGDEYLGKSPRFGYWRDTFLRLEGPAVAGLQRVFVEDWDFAAREALDGDAYFPPPEEAGGATVQVVESSPGQEPNSIREIYFAAILAARQRVWVASPYFVPDSGLLDALRLACYRGVDVRLLCLSRPDHFLSFYASRYYWADLLAAGVRIYPYTRGMMHAKLLLVDGEWALVGSANLDNRSLHLNFEVGCMLYTRALVAELEEQFRRDLDDSVPLDAAAFARRPFAVRLAENACRLFSPIL